MKGSKGIFTHSDTHGNERHRIVVGIQHGILADNDGGGGQKKRRKRVL